MPRIPPLLLALAVLAAPFSTGAVAEEPATVAWNDWDAAPFSKAQREGRLIVVTVSAGWCHGCHVMQRKACADPRVARRIAAGYVPIKVDADARPDLAECYAEYHWPATVFLTRDAKPLVSRPAPAISVERAAAVRGDDADVEGARALLAVPGIGASLAERLGRRISSQARG